jgi:prepilin peptidase CpaA
LHGVNLIDAVIPGAKAIEMLADVIRVLLFPALMAFAASSDLLTMTISNKLSLALIAGFCLLTLVIGMSWPAIGTHLVAAALVLMVSFGFFSQGWIGGGDAKLVAATALWFGFDNLIDYLVYASLFGGVLTIALIQLRKLPLPASLARQPWILRLHDAGGGIPYGIALAAAALTVYPKTGWMPAIGM